MDKVINNILTQPVGVLGITAKDPLSFNRPRWFSGVYRLLQLALRLPEEGGKQVRVFIKPHSGFNADTDLQVLKQLLLSKLQSINETRFSQFGLSLETAPKGKHPLSRPYGRAGTLLGRLVCQETFDKSQIQRLLFPYARSGDL